MLDGNEFAEKLEWAYKAMSYHLFELEVFDSDRQTVREFSNKTTYGNLGDEAIEKYLTVVSKLRKVIGG